MVINNSLIVEYVNPAIYNIFSSCNKIINKSIFEIIKDENIFDVIKKVITDNIAIINSKISIIDDTKRDFLVDMYPVKLEKDTKFVIILKEISQMQISESKEERFKQLKVIEETIEYIINKFLPKLETSVSLLDLINTTENWEELNMLNKLINEMYSYIKDLQDLIYEDELKVKINIHKILEDSMVIVEEWLKEKKAKITKNYDPTIPEIEANPIALIKAFSNIMIVIVKKLNEKDTISITTRQLNNIRLRPDKKTVVIEIKITTENSKEINSKLFETSNPKLLLSYKIISDNGGLIDTILRDRTITIRVLLPS